MTANTMQPAASNPARRWGCYCGRAYQIPASLQRHFRTCPAASSEDCKLLLQLLACLEHQPIPGDLLYRALYPYRAWNENGNLSFGHLQLPMIFETQDRLEQAVQSAITAGAVQVTIGTIVPDTGRSDAAVDAPWWAYRNFKLTGPSRISIRSELISTHTYRERELDTGRLLLHAFPTPDHDER
jgi:hypothetical protein